MIQFSKLRLSGFKSFVDKTELDIAQGLTGVVGPNGCGKSNLVEALRWVMGENSAKRMRGGGMEDVIFNGTTKRSARNLAEVSLLLDNGTRSAPSAYNGSDEIEVTRKIERDHGSNYKINGKNVRARDVQMLFADTVTGANSPALVSQGRVAQIINSKPLERRMILEESAGISGLYARRHEAELRLKAADANLKRVEDILGSMDSRLNDLKRQLRQATRYRNVNAQIRQMEIQVAWLEWQSLQTRIDACKKTFAEAESLVAEHLTTVTQLTKTQTTQSQDLPALRLAETEAAAALQTVKISLQRIEDEAARHEQALRETQTQLEQAQTDQAHENHVLEESSSVLERLEKEQSAIASEQDNETGEFEKKQDARNALEEKVVTLEAKYTALMESAAERRAFRQSLEQQVNQNRERIKTVTERRQKAQDDLLRFETTEKIDNKAGIENKINELSQKSTDFSKEIETLIQQIETSREDVVKLRSSLTKAEAARSEFRAESGMLENLLRDDGSGQFKPVLDQLTTQAGFEKAISRALGDALLASLESDAPARWLNRSDAQTLPALPGQVAPLLPMIDAPPELHAALSQIGLVRDESEGHALRDNLLPGQSLVSRDGFYWRWDGYFVKAQASDRNAFHLEQKNKFKELQKRGPEIERNAEDCETALKQAEEKLSVFEMRRKALESDLRKTEEELTRSRSELGVAREAQVRVEGEIARLKEIIRTTDEDIQTLEEVIRWNNDRLEAYEKVSNEQNEEDTEEVRKVLTEARESHNAAVIAFDLFQQQQSSRKARLHAISDERINTQNRLIRSRERLKQLEERQQTLSRKFEELKQQPANFEDDKEKFLGKLSELEKLRDTAAERLATCERDVAETGRALKQAESQLGECRETRAGANATLATLIEQEKTVEFAIREQFNVAPSELPENAAIDINESPDNLETLRAKKEKLIREREGIGPVNLRAEEEMQTLEAEAGGMISERNDLVQAIEELRGGINTINKEAQERLLAAFEQINAHFQKLFTQLFGGGNAHLALIDSDDPLGAGLEIYAQPPGKTLQSLSLLSGGEQAMTSIALVFGMFLTNPSPICVLDEIDAPLDDANVDRVCTLLEEIAARGETRFLVITHHRMTMARMHRLYGVTMAERGVSQLVSVDLQQSFEFLEAA